MFYLVKIWPARRIGAVQLTLSDTLFKLAACSGVHGGISASTNERDRRGEGPGKSVPLRWLVLGLFFFQPDRG